jgi:hypothetical protein
MSAIWGWMKHNKWKAALGVSASASALMYTLREPIMDVVKPVGERLLAYAMEQQLTAMKLQGRAETRKTQFKQIGEKTFTNGATHEMMSVILKRVKTKLSVKHVVEALKSTKVQDLSTPELKAEVFRVQGELYNEIIASRLAEYAACIYTSGMLVATFRLYLVVLGRHKLDRQPPLPKETTSGGGGGGGGGGEKKGVDPHDLIESAKRFGLNDLRSRVTQEAVHKHAWDLVFQSLDTIIIAAKQAATNCLSDVPWVRTSYVNHEEMTDIVDKILGNMHELLFNAHLVHDGYALDITSIVSRLQADPDQACASVIAEANCMVCSDVFLDVMASTVSSVSLQYAETLKKNLCDSIPRDGPCEVDQNKLASFLNEVAGVVELVPSIQTLQKQEAEQSNSSSENNENNVIKKEVEVIVLEEKVSEEKEKAAIIDIQSTKIPQCNRALLCERLTENNGEMIQRLAGFGPQMAARKESKAFITQCIKVVREGPDDVLVDAEELTEILEAVLDDVTNRLQLLTAVGKAGLGKTQTSLCKGTAKISSSSSSSSSSSASGESPLDPVLDEPCLDHFLGAVFEDVVDVVTDRQNNGVNDEDGEDGSEAMVMQQLQAMMSGAAEDGDDNSVGNIMSSSSGGGGGGSGGMPDMSQLNDVFAQLGQTPPTAEEMAEMDKMFQQMMPSLGGMGDGANGNQMPDLGALMNNGGVGGGMPDPREMEQLMQQLGQADPAAMDEMMKMMQSPELQQMGEQMAAAMAAGGNVGNMD